MFGKNPIIFVNDITNILSSFCSSSMTTIPVNQVDRNRKSGMFSSIILGPLSLGFLSSINAGRNSRKTGINIPRNKAIMWRGVMSMKNLGAPGIRTRYNDLHFPGARS